MDNLPDKKEDALDEKIEGADVIAKLEDKSIISNLAFRIKRSPPSSRIKILNDFREERHLSDEQFAKVLMSLIKSYQIHLLGENFKKELKKITDHAPIKIYFDLEYY